jgi:acyl-CoA synthetase (AMP-forming)/AMP-acid ligase II
MACMKKSLGSYKTPKSIAFAEHLPLSPVGKVLRRNVRERYLNAQDRRIN